ncbi:MAG: 4Fe-4S dicluster domain-containing protein [Desulfovibrio sp.]|nr:MAG: 4Fe-4S dicluster domain-containing protein [Desulfovibrio sp.]
MDIPKHKPQVTDQGQAVFPRRAFLRRTTTLGIAALLGSTVGGAAYWLLGNTSRKILVDYAKCTGCRTCEAVCAGVNAAVAQGVGNPHFANIKVHSYNPDVDVPSLCLFCADGPCLQACPVGRDSDAGEKALYRDAITRAITVRPELCISCGSCAEACSAQGSGVITLHPHTQHPAGMCTLCDGAPQCVAHCPQGALSIASEEHPQPFASMAPNTIATYLTHQWYTLHP